MKLTISLLLAFFAFCGNVCYAAPVVMPEGKLDKLGFIIKTFKMPPENIWVYATIVVVLIVSMMLDLTIYAPSKKKNIKNNKKEG